MLEEEKNQAPEEEIEEGEVVELDVPEEDQEAQAAVEDVSEEETKKDEEQDELENYSKGVQKRIATLTKKMREQERAAQSAYEYAKSLQEENENLKTSTSELNKNETNDNNFPEKITTEFFLGIFFNEKYYDITKDVINKTTWK